MKLNILKKDPLVSQMQINTEANLMQQSKTLSDFNHTQENQDKQKASHRDIQRHKINFTNNNMYNSQGMQDIESLISNEFNSPLQGQGNNNNHNNLEIKTNFANSQNTSENIFYDNNYDSPQYKTERNKSRVRHKRNFAKQDSNLQNEMQLSLPQNEQKGAPKISIFGQNNIFNNQSVEIQTNTGQNQKISNFFNNNSALIEQQINLKDLEAKNTTTLRKSKSPLPQQSIIQESMNKTPQNFLLKTPKQVQKKLDFSEGDDYFFFDPKKKINDLIINQNQLESQSSSQVQMVKKTILKPFQKPVSVTESQKLKKQKSTSDFDDLQIEDKQKISVIKSDSNLESVQSKKEENIEQINSQNVLHINQRARQGIVFSSEYNLEYLISQNNFGRSKFNSKIKVLNDYEKASYMRRASDINKLILFQKKNTNQMKQKIEEYFEVVFNFQKKFFCFQIWTETYPSLVNITWQAWQEFNNLWLNIIFIGLLIFLYSIIQLYNHPSYSSDSNLVNHIFLDSESGYLAYSGHLFLLLFTLLFIKLCQCYGQQYVCKNEKPSVSLIFSELKWNGQRKQIPFLLKKAQLIDQIYENIDNNEKFDINQQFVFVIFLEIFILISDSAILYYILDGNQFFRIANDLTESNYFLSSFIVSLLTSTLMQLNTYLLQIIFSCLSQIEFSYFEIHQYYLIFLSQMFILIVFQIRIITYLNSEYNFCFTNLKIDEKFQISYLNLTLILSQIVVNILARILSLFFEKIHNLMSKREEKNQTKKSKNSIYPYQQDPQSNKEILKEYIIDPKQKVVTTDEIQNYQTINKLEKLDNCTSSNGNIIINKGEKSQNQKNISLDNIIKSTYQQENQDESNQVSILKVSFIIREIIFLITVNYLVICNSILQPSIYVIGLAINILHKIINKQQSDRVDYYLSLLNYIQFKSIHSIFCLIALLFSFVFNFIVGLNVKPQNINYTSLFALEFSYIFDVERINCILKLVTLPQLLFSIIIFLSFIYVKQRTHHKKYENHLISMYQQLKNPVQHKTQFQ
ncbi:hypothetical protein ABPG74_021240 [Tetrahymena malaccensis]